MRVSTAEQRARFKQFRHQILNKKNEPTEICVGCLQPTSVVYTFYSEGEYVRDYVIPAEFQPESVRSGIKGVPSRMTSELGKGFCDVCSMKIAGYIQMAMDMGTLRNTDESD